MRVDGELAVLTALAGSQQDRAEFGALGREHVRGRVADHPAALQVEVELLLGHLVDAGPGLAEHALLAEAALALRVVGAAVDLRDRDLLLLHAGDEHLAEAGEVAFLQFAEGDVLAARGHEELELLGVDALQRFQALREERDRTVGGELGALYEDAVEFEEDALLVGDLGHRLVAPAPASARWHGAWRTAENDPIGRPIGGSPHWRSAIGTLLWTGVCIRAVDLGSAGGPPHRRSPCQKGCPGQ